MPYNRVYKIGSVVIGIDRKRFVLSLKSPFKQEFIDELRYRIAPPHRDWVKEKKIWIIDLDFIEEVEEMVRRHFKEE